MSLQLNTLEPHIVSLSVAESETIDLKKNIEQRGREPNGFGNEKRVETTERETHRKRKHSQPVQNHDARL